MNCIVCQDVPKYKCPVCCEPYCSVNCYKKHKELPCVAPNTVAKEEEQNVYLATYEFPTDDTVPPEKLKLLDSSKDVKTCLENPHVRQILQELDRSPHPDKLIQEYMLEPIFTELVDACLKAVEPQEDT